MKKKGFTLVELLAVIVILTIIALIAVPSILGIIEKTRIDAWLRQKEFIEKAAKLYMTKHEVPKDRYVTLRKLIDEGCINGNIKDYQGNIIDNEFAADLSSDYIEGNNLISGTSFKFGSPWGGWNGSTFTLTQDISVPEWETNKATKIHAEGGSNTKFLNAFGAIPLGEHRSISIYVKNIGSKQFKVGSLFDGRFVTILPNQSKFIYWEDFEGTGSGNLQIQFVTNDVEDKLDFIAYQPRMWRVASE